MPSVHGVRINHWYVIKIKDYFSATAWMHLCHLFNNKFVTKNQLSAFVLKTVN